MGGVGGVGEGGEQRERSGLSTDREVGANMAG